jgi:hypothetical protein
VSIVSGHEKERTTMLSENIIQRLGRLVKLAPWLPKEKQEELHEIIKEMMVAERTEGTMPNSAIADLAEAVPDKLIREIVRDLKGAGNTQPGWLPPSKPKPVERRSGSVEPRAGKPEEPFSRWSK